MGGKLQQCNVVLLRPWEVVPLVDYRVHRQFHILSDANVGGVDAGDVVLSEDERHRPLGKEGEGGDAVGGSDRPVCGNQGCRTAPGSLACALFSDFFFNAASSPVLPRKLMAAIHGYFPRWVKQFAERVHSGCVTSTQVTLVLPL